jgi:hypothetical protein
MYEMPPIFWPNSLESRAFPAFLPMGKNPRQPLSRPCAFPVRKHLRGGNEQSGPEGAERLSLGPGPPHPPSRNARAK